MGYAAELVFFSVYYSFVNGEDALVGFLRNAVSAVVAFHFGCFHFFAAASFFFK